MTLIQELLQIYKDFNVKENLNVEVDRIQNNLLWVEINGESYGYTRGESGKTLIEMQKELNRKSLPKQKLDLLKNPNFAKHVSGGILGDVKLPYKD